MVLFVGVLSCSLAFLSDISGVFLAVVMTTEHTRHNGRCVDPDCNLFTRTAEKHPVYSHQLCTKHFACSSENRCDTCVSFTANDWASLLTYYRTFPCCSSGN